MTFATSEDSIPMITRWLVPLLVASAPLAMILLTWSGSSFEPGPGDRVIKFLALPVICVELACILIALRVAPPNHFPPLPTWIRAGIGLFVLLACGTLFWVAGDRMTGAIWTALHFVHLAFGFAIYRLCASRVVPIQRLTDALIAGFVAATLALIVFVSSIADRAAFDWLNGLPGYDNIRRIGYYAAPILALCIGIAATDDNPRRRRAVLAVIALGSGLIVWTGVRGAAAALIVGSVLAAPFLRRLRSSAGPIAAAVLIGALTASLIPTLAPFMGPERMIRTEVTPAGSPPESGLLSGRIELWAETLQAIGARPLFGHGEAQTHQLGEVVAAMSTLHPHNILLQTLLAWGLVGTILLAILALPLLRTIFCAARLHGRDYLAHALAVVVLLIYSMVDGTLFHVLAASLFALSAGAAASGMQAAPHKPAIPNQTGGG
jgi:O-antigen ligase